MRRLTNISGKEDNVFKRIRLYLGLSIEEIARAIGVSSFTWWRWESGMIEIPSQANVNKIANLIKKKSNKDFKLEFLKLVIYNKKVQFFGREEQDIVEEIEKNQDKFMDSPIWGKVFKENPELKGLPFREIYKKYTKGKITYDGIFLLNSLPISSSKKRYRRGNKKSVSQNKRMIRNTKVIKNRARGKKKQKSAGGRKVKRVDSTGNDDDDDGGSTDSEIKENSEARYNLVKLFYVLWEVDLRLNPQKYTKRSER